MLSNKLKNKKYINQSDETACYDGKSIAPTFISYFCMKREQPIAFI
ncbi:hypothetical protein ykris0001_28530 [Yersinia kristensenii ATCC 33638]|nr:hypothetical protein ykris0001_28530 [Yersinia kristensenii ATCC 33638]